MIIDIHTHIFPRKILENRSDYFTGEPAFELLYRPFGARLCACDDLIAAMDANGVDKSVAFGFPWKKAELFQAHNDYIMEAVNRHPDRLIGLGCFDIANSLAAREVIRCFEGGLVGIGELALYEIGLDGASLQQFEPLMEICRDYNAPILIHTNEPVGHFYPGKTPITLVQIYNLIKAFPANLIILAHWGGGIFFFNLLKREVKETLKNVYFDTAASPFLYDPEIYRLAVQTLGPEKILFGSDYPLIAPARYFSEIKTAHLTGSEIKAICGDNAASLLNL